MEDTINDQLKWKRQLDDKRSNTAQNEDDVAEEQEPPSLRQVMAMKRIRVAQALAQSEAEAAASGGGASGGVIGARLKDYLLDAIPGVGPYRVLANFLTGKAIKTGLLRIFIMLFSNIEIVVIILAVLTFLCMIIYFGDMSGIKQIKALWDAFMSLNWWGIKALVLFIRAVKF